LQLLTKWPIEASIITVATITMVYTFLGGMKAVIWTDVIQFTVYIGGAFVALLLLVGKLPGGWAELLETARGADKFRVLDFTFDLTKPFTFWSGVVGGMVLNTATHGADQMMVQRYLCARSQKQAAVALVASGFVILIQFAFFLFIGASLWVFYREFPPTLSGGIEAFTSGQSDKAFPYFIVHYLPTGVLGLVIAAIFSAAMGTLAGSLNASASSIVNDLYRPLTGRNDEKHLMRVSRGMTVAWALVLTIVAIGAQQLEDNVVNNALAIAGFVSGILLGLFLLGILTQRVGQQAALLGVLAGVAAVSFAKFGTPYLGVPLAWPWFALVGSSTVFSVGLLASLALPRYDKGHEKDLSENVGLAND
jgi:SSS family transporter